MRPAGESLTLSDAELVDRIRVGETVLYGVLIQRYQKRFYGIVYRILRDAAETEDAVQEAHAHAFMHLAQFAGRSSILSWITQIMIYEALSRLRHRQRFHHSESLSTTDCADGVTVTSSTRDPEQQAVDVELSTILETALKSLPEAYRSVFAAREIDEMSTAEAAYHLGITEQCVKTRLLRARALLRRRVRKHLQPAMPTDHRNKSTQRRNNRAESRAAFSGACGTVESHDLEATGWAA